MKPLALWRVVVQAVRRLKPPWRVVLVSFLLLHTAVGLLVGPLVVATILIVETAVFSWVFVGGYWPRNWRESEMGKQIMSHGVVIALLMTVSLIPDSFGFNGSIAEWVSMFIILAMAAVSLNLVRLLFHYPEEDA